MKEKYIDTISGEELIKITDNRKVNDPYIEYYNSKGELHRVDGPAEIYKNGYKSWYQNDKYHREDGPSIVGSNGSKAWYQNDKPHRLDGPAIVYSNGDKEWFINGKEYTELEFNIQVRKLKIENL